MTVDESVLDENLNQPATKTTAKVFGDVTNVDVTCRQQSEIKIFIKHKKCQNRNRLKFWRYFSPKSPATTTTTTTSTAVRSGDRRRHQSKRRHAPTAVHFYSPVLQQQQPPQPEVDLQRQPLCPGSAVQTIAVDFGSPDLVASSADDDDLEAYMQEIKQRESQIVP
uniref:(northern house mosquito) hypothetical protein n=3 Tax=Culex pipiens TaxID=7175 RepID=A0A8D8B491_CULPI